MFYGEYSHSIDPKGRLTIPAKIRQELGDECVITRGFATCLNVYSLEEFKRVEQRILKNNNYSKEYGQFQRSFFSSVQICTYDKQGRINISQTLRDKVGLDKEVMIIGSSTNIEIWDKEVWESYSDIDNETFEALGSAIMGMGFEPTGFNE